MADRIVVSTELLDQWASRLASIESTVASVQSILAGVNTSERAGGLLRVNISGSLTNGARYSGGNVASILGSLGSAVGATGSHVGKLSRATSAAARMFESAEQANQRNIDTGEAGENQNGSGVAAGAIAAAGLAKYATDAPNKISFDWWKLFKDVFSKFSPAWGFILEVWDYLKGGKKGDFFNILKHLAKGAKPIVKWLPWLFANKTLNMGDKIWNFLTKQVKPSWNKAPEGTGTIIDLVFSGITTFIDNAKEVWDKKISVDRGIVEWRTEWALDFVKTIGIAAAGKAIGGAIVAAIGATGGVAVAIPVLAVGAVAGIYCVADWAFKTFVSKDGRGIIEEAGHQVGELYDKGKKVVKDVIDSGIEKVKKWKAKIGKVKWALIC